MTARLLRRQEVEARTALATSTIYRRMGQGTFPRPRDLKGCVRWLEADIDAWIEGQDESKPRKAA